MAEKQQDGATAQNSAPEQVAIGISVMRGQPAYSGIYLHDPETDSDVRLRPGWLMVMSREEAQKLRASMDGIDIVLISEAEILQAEASGEYERHGSVLRPPTPEAERRLTAA